MTAKGLAGSAVVLGGTYAANRYLSSHNITLNRNAVRINPDAVNKFNRAVKVGKEFLKYV